MKPVERDILHALVSAVVDDTIGDDQAAELIRMLGADADARRFYVRYLDMHAAMGEAAARPETADRWRVPWIAIVASLMAASLLVAWIAAPVGERPDGSGIPGPRGLAADVAPSSSYVATITAASGDAVLNGGPIVAGTRLTPGPYEVAVGTVTVQFDGGAHIFFAGQARFTLRSRRALTIDRGTFVFEGDQSCEPIEIVTPHSVFRNIGTRYAAVIGADAEEVHVAEGSVRRTSGQGDRPAREELIEAGVGRRYAAADARAESIPLDAALVGKSLDAVSAGVDGARPLVVDGFRGDQDQVRGLRSGRGWAEPWRSALGDWQLVKPGLSGAGSVALRHDGSGGIAERRRSAAHRRLQTPIDLSQDGIWYLRFLVRRGPVKPKDDHRAMVVLRTHGLSPQDEIDRGALIQVALRRDDAAMIRLAGTLTRVSLPQVPGQSYAVIAKIVAGRDRPEQVLVRVMAADQLAGSGEPADWSMVSESVQTDIRIDQVSLECTSGGRIDFGDLCIGTTWESVVASVSEPGAP